jgi:hypothetical protein
VLRTEVFQYLIEVTMDLSTAEYSLQRKLKMPQVVRTLKSFPTFYDFMEPEDSLPHSQEPCTGP